MISVYTECDLTICLLFCWYFFFFKQKTAYEMRISDWSSDVCSSDLPGGNPELLRQVPLMLRRYRARRQGLAETNGTFGNGHNGKGQNVLSRDRKSVV